MEQEENVEDRVETKSHEKEEHETKSTTVNEEETVTTEPKPSDAKRKQLEASNLRINVSPCIVKVQVSHVIALNHYDRKQNATCKS